MALDWLKIYESKLVIIVGIHYFDFTELKISVVSLFFYSFLGHKYTYCHYDDT